MQFSRAIAIAALLSALLVSMLWVSEGASAFETTSIGGVNSDGSAKYQDPDELGSALAPSAANSSPFGNFNFSVGSTPDSSDSSGTNWLNGPGSSRFGFSGSSSQNSSSEPPSPFNTPILRDRN